MIQKFLSKYFLEVIPSVVATVLGAYIVTHYVNSKPESDKPAVAASSPATPVKAVSGAPDKPKPENVKPEIAKPEAVKAESPKAEFPKPESVKAESVKAEPESAKSETEKSSEKSAQAARVLRHHQVVVKERAAKAAALEKAAPVEATATPEDRRDANDIARAAIERLRSSEPRAAEPKTPERKLNTVGYAPAVAPLQTPAAASSQTFAPLTYAPQAYSPPPVQAASPPAAYVPPPAQTAVIAPMPPATSIAPIPAPPASVVRAEDPSRPTPPADIPSRPLDIRAKDGAKDTSVAEDVVSAAKNAFEAVLPR